MEYTCGGCTRCCENFALHEETIQQVGRTHPGLLEVVGGLTRVASVVKCNQLIPGEGCGIHPSRVGDETRPGFCGVPVPWNCGNGTKLEG